MPGQTLGPCLAHRPLLNFSGWPGPGLKKILNVPGFSVSGLSRAWAEPGVG